MNENKTNNRVYLDYQASTMIDNEVLREMLPYFKDYYGNPHSHHHVTGWEANKAIEDARRNVAELINADPHEIIFTSGATEANNLALIGIASKSKNTRKQILVSEVEHKCVLSAAQSLAKKQGYNIKTIPVDQNGIIDINALISLLNENVLLVSVMLANNEIGSIQPIKSIAKLVHNEGAIMHTDAAQGPTNDVIDVKELDIDLMSLSAHKMYGPKGVGALYIRNGMESNLDPIIWGGGQENGLRSGTLPTPLCAGFGAASKLIKFEGKSIADRTRSMRDLFFYECKKLNTKIRLIGPQLEQRHASNLSLLFEDYDAEDLISIMQPDLSVSTGSACSSVTHEPSHVLEAIGLVYPENKKVIRFSFGKCTTKNEIRLAVSHLKKAIDKINDNIY